jgi:hypothetical protein
MGLMMMNEWDGTRRELGICSQWVDGQSMDLPFTSCRCGKAIWLLWSQFLCENSTNVSVVIRMERHAGASRCLAPQAVDSESSVDGVALDGTT